LYWGLMNYNDMKMMGLLEAKNSSGEGYVKLGAIIISNENAPEGMSNLSWDKVPSID